MALTLRKALLAGAIVAAALVVVRADVLADLGIEAAEAPHLAVQAAIAGTVPWAAAQKFKAAAPTQKVALVRSAIGWAKTFTASAPFASAYAQARDRVKPGPPENALSFDDRMKEQLEQIDKSEAEMKKNLAAQPAMLKQVLEGLEASRQQIQAMSKNPDIRKSFEMQGAEAKKAYAADLAKFDREHPADARAAIAIQLHHFLDVCRDVDFGAQLKGSGSSKVFANPAYEQKSSEWKMCFRAGREPVEAARTLAEAWLKELGK